MTGSEATIVIADQRVPAVQLDDLVVAYDGVVAVDSVSLVVDAGSTVAVIGPSGSGKSTLLRAVAGLEPVVSGVVSLFGVDCTRMPPDQRRVGLMFQDHALFPHLDVAGNVAFGLRMRGADDATIAARTAEVLDLVGLSGFDRRSVDALSGGEAQRVALARSLAPEPTVLMLDEPLGSLDRVLREELVADLRHIFHDPELTVLHVTHDQQEAFTIADEVVVMRDGVVAQRGVPAEIWRRPDSPFVARFLGHPNLWSTERGTVLAPLQAIRLLDPVSAAAQPGEIFSSSEIVDVILVNAEFREGRHRITAVERAATSGEPRRFVFDTDHDPGPQRPRHLRVAVDRTMLVELADR